MSKFAFDVQENGLVEVCLDVTDNFSGKDRVALTERLTRPGKPNSSGVLIYEVFMIVLVPSVHLPVSESLKLLEEGLREINEADQFNRCTEICIQFPDFLPHVVQGLGRFTLPYLQRLIFFGNRTQLPLILSPGTIPSRLKTLSLICDLTVCDCAYLLKELSDTLVFFYVGRLTLPDHGTTTTMFPGFQSHLIEGRIRMTSLYVIEFLELFVNPIEMLNKFEMPALRRFCINGMNEHGRKGITKKDFKWIRWSGVKETNIPDV